MGKSRNISNAEDRYVNAAGDTMTGTLNVDGTGQVRGYADASDSITVIGGENDTNNRIQVRGSSHPSTPNVITFDTSGGEAMRIDASGNVLIGKTTTATSTQGTHIGNNSEIHLARVPTDKTLRFYNANTGSEVGYILVGASATTYATSSDYRLKENVATMTGALAKVAQLNPVTYTWRADGSAGQGFIAHELQAVVPDAVTGEKDAVDQDGNPVYQGIDASFLVATLAAAIQELSAELADAKSRIAALEAK